MIDDEAVEEICSLLDLLLHGCDNSGAVPLLGVVLKANIGTPRP